MEVYRELATFPSVTRARICNAQAPGHVRVYSVWSQRDLERGETVKFGRGHIVQLDVVFPTPPSNVATELVCQNSGYVIQVNVSFIISLCHIVELRIFIKLKCCTDTCIRLSLK